MNVGGHYLNWSKRVCLILFWCSTVIASGSALADDARVRITVKRDANLLMSRGVNVYVYVNEHHVGTLENGEDTTFAFPISSDGRYEIKFDNWTGIASSNTVTVHAKPDEHIVCSVGTEMGLWVQGLRGRDAYVEPLYPAKIYFQTDGPKDIVVDDKVYPLTASGFVELPLKTTASGILRVEYGIAGQQDRYPLFLSPSHVPLVDLANKASADTKLLVSEEYLLQLESARIFHFWSQNPSVFGRMDAFVSDVKSLRSTSFGEKVLRYRDSEIAWLDAIRPVVETSMSAEVAAGAITAVLTCSLEAILTRQPPSNAHLAWESFQVAFSASYNHFSRKREIQDRFNDINESREALFDALQISDERLRNKELNQAFEDWRLRRTIVGEWSYSFPYESKPRTYVFGAAGLLKETYGDGSESLGSYVIDNGRIIIRWPSGSEEIADCRKLSKNSFTYEIASHSGDSSQNGLALEFSRR